MEDNKIIAEFMGGLKGGKSRLSLQKNEIWLPTHGVCRLGNSGKVLKYHSSWDWLMEVVEQIENTEVESNYLMLESIGNMAKFIYDDGCRFLKDNIGETKIQAVYEACVEFIKWYNENREQ